MDTTTRALLSLFSFVLCSLLSFLFFLSTKKKNTSIRLPPGPWSTPILGTIRQIKMSLLDVSLTLRRLRPQYGPVISFKVGPLLSVFVVDRHVAHQALVQSSAAFADRPPIRRGGARELFTSNGHTISSGRGAIWRLLRRNLASEIIYPGVKAFAGGRRWVLERLIGDLREKSEAGEGVVVVAETLRHAMFRLLVFMCFGEKLDDTIVGDIEDVQRAFLLMNWDLTIFEFMPKVAKVVLWRRWRRFLENHRRKVEIMMPLITARRNAKQNQQHRKDDDPQLAVCYVDSLLDLEIPEEGGRKFTDDEIVNLCSEFFNAGTDTTATSMEWIMAEVVKHPHIQQRLLDEINSVVHHGQEIHEDDLHKMPYLKAVILEGLRRHPSAGFLLPHFMPEEAPLEGYTIPKRALINFAAAEIGWDGEVWEEPFEFRPERFLGEGAHVDITGSREMKMMPFGAGRRICPGLNLAMLHLEYYLACLVREFEWKTVEGEEVDLSETVEFTLVMKNPLRARLIQRESTPASY